MVTRSPIFVLHLVLHVDQCKPFDKILLQFETKKSQRLSKQEINEMVEAAGLDQVSEIKNLLHLMSFETNSAWTTTKMSRFPLKVT